MFQNKIVAEHEFRPIKDSVFSFFKIIVGPSSSHTAGVYKIGTRIREQILQQEEMPKRVVLEFCNSLSATGIGHYSDIALAGALFGCAMSNLAYYKDHYDQTQPIVISGSRGSCTIIPERDFVFDQEDRNDLPANTLIARLYAEDIQKVCLHYESVGGGRISPDIPDRLDDIPSAYHFSSWRSFMTQVGESDKSIIDFIMRREALLHDVAASSLTRRMDQILSIMVNAVEHGLAYSADDLLPSGLLRYRAQLLMRDALERKDVYSIAGAAAMAASEHNASMGEMITAPTAGGGGVVPGVMYALLQHGVAREKLIESLFVAGVIGQIIEHNACVSGAKAGCTFEIGAAAAMASAAGVYALSTDTLESRTWLLHALEQSAQEIFAHYPNLPCDPIGGLVQIPCIERNKDFAIIVMGKIFSTLAPNPYYVAPLHFDDVLSDSYTKGLLLPREYRETSLGGLARLPLRLDRDDKK